MKCPDSMSSCVQMKTLEGGFCVDNGDYVFQAPKPLELKICGNDLQTQVRNALVFYWNFGNSSVIYPVLCFGTNYWTANFFLGGMGGDSGFAMLPDWAKIRQTFL